MASTLQAIIPFADPNHISTEPEQPVFGWQAGGLLVPRGHATILRAHRQSVGHSYAMCPVLLCGISAEDYSCRNAV